MSNQNILNDKNSNLAQTLLRIIPVVVLIATAGGGWAVNTWRDEHQEKEIEKLKSENKTILNRTARMDERQKNIQGDVKEIRRLIERIHR